MKNLLACSVLLILFPLSVFAQVPEIDVTGNGNPIPDGNTITSALDYTYFTGLRICGETFSRSYIISNSGTDDLHISNAFLTGTNAADFTISVPPSATVAPGSSTTVTVVYDPAASGYSNATLNIVSDDSDEGNYDFALEGSGYEPEINVLGNAQYISNGDLTPSASDYTSFGSVNECGASVLTRTFTIENGAAGYGLANIAVTISGANASDFTLTTAPANFVTWVMHTTDFTITFDPSSTGLRTAMVSIASDDCNENPFTFAIEGVGTGDVTPPVIRNFTCGTTSAASATAYSDGWQTGDNDGSGFSAWTLVASTGNTSQAGFVRSSSTTNGAGTDPNNDGDVNSGGVAWGSYASAGQGTYAYRNFSSVLGVGYRFTMEFDNGVVDNGQIISVMLQNISGGNLTQVRYRGGQAGYELVDNNGITPFNLIGYTDQGVILEAIPVSASQVSIRLTRKIDGVSQTLLSTQVAGPSDQQIRRVRMENSNAGSGVNHYFYYNNMTVCTVATGCPSNISMAVTSACGTTVSYPSFDAIDNCSGTLAVTQTAGLPSGTFFPVGNTVNTFSATDGSGNTSTCSFTVTVTDVAPPVALCQNLTVRLNSSGNALLIPAMLDNGSYDNCSIFTKSLSLSSVSCANLGPNNVTLTITDAAGNSSTCTSVVTVVDTTRPVVNCRNVTVNLDASGTATVTAAMINNGSSDNCGIASMTVTPSSFNCSQTGNNAVTLTVTDGSGNSASCSATVLVLDSIAPVTLCRNATIYLNAAGTASLSPLDVDNGSHDECAIVQRQVNPNAFTCANLGNNAVTLTNWDSFGHNTSGSATVTVLDTIRPSVLYNNPTIYLDATGNVALTVAQVDNGSTDNCSIASRTISSNSFSCANTGSNIVTYTVTDGSGNSRSVSVTVTVLDTIHPVASCQGIVVTLNASGNATVTGAMINNGSSDNCGIASMTVTPSSFSCSTIGANAVLFTVTDNSGNTSTCTTTVTVLGSLSASATATSILCNGGSATVSVTANGGTAPYSGTGSFTRTAGSYTFTVTDANGCSATTSVTITEPTLLNANATATSILCNGGNATVNVTANGGTAPYSGTGSFTRTAGSYTFTVTDANGCTATTSVTITEPTLLTANATATSILCNGGNATVNVTANGGTAPYSGTGSFTRAAGSYTFTVTDANGCSATTSVTITEPTLLTANATATSILCNGGNATVNVSANGGTAPYSGTGSFTRTAGSYTFTITDANGCSATTSITITEPTLLSANATATSILCNGGNATVSVTANGGTAPYSGTGSFTRTAGSYTFTVTDANGCSATTSVTITEPTLLTANATATSILCNGGNTTVNATANGGTAPYSGTGSFTRTAGSYTFTVTDANGCSATTSVTITEPTAISISSSVTDVHCNGGTDGAIDITASGGTGSFSYDWNSGLSTNEDLTLLSSGSYTVTVTDANSCTQQAVITITQPAALIAGIDSLRHPSSCNGSNGEIYTSVSGGIAPYSFTWSNSASTEDIIGLVAGTYTCTITDANNCTTSLSQTLQDPALPTVSLSLPMDTVCQTTQLPFQLTGASPAGGIFSGPGVTGNTFDPMATSLGYSGITYVYTDTNGCSGTAIDSFYVDICSGQPEIVGMENVFTVYPNPGNGQITIHSSLGQEAKAEIYNMTGQLLLEKTLQPGTDDLLLLEQSGVYTIVVTTADGHRFTRLVIVNR